ncbi:MAG: adenylosuccinate lyase [Clostridiales bacterium]|nr:adenylosuccinate lyase [Clostridiales bacterium]
MHEKYENPLIIRYATKQMQYCFGDNQKFMTWRKLWTALAESEMELGLDITIDQVEELRSKIEDINYDVADAREKEVRHDVMAHVYAYGKQCPNARAIIHLGATSCYVGDNADLIVIHNALDIVKSTLVNVIDKLSNFAIKYKDLPTLGYTHYQPAQLTTVGKRASLWIQDLIMDYEELERLTNNKKLRGVKGTTGTQDSFMALFDGDESKVLQLNTLVCKKLGYTDTFTVTGQTYPRKYDTQVVNCLNLIAQSAYKFANDLRLLQNQKELEEPFSKKQIGSSAMAYKRNPMRSERICALSRFVNSLASSTVNTASTQWLERTLDDSANKRLVIPQAFLAIDAILNLYLNIASDIVVYENMIDKHIQEELPFMATERIMMAAVQKGGDRQELHDHIRTHSMEAAKQVKLEGKQNDLITRIKDDAIFDCIKDEIDNLLDAKKYTGRSASQVMELYNNYVKPILKDNKDQLDKSGEVNV